MLWRGMHWSCNALIPLQFPGYGVITNLPVGSVWAGWELQTVALKVRTIVVLICQQVLRSRHIATLVVTNPIGKHAK